MPVKHEISRIYQGRVTSCTIHGTDATQCLLEHHELFQDAVNYYLLVLASMAFDPATPAGRLRQQMQAMPEDGGTWEHFYRNGSLREGMKYSAMRTFNITSGELSFAEACKLALDNNQTKPEILQDAVTLITQQCMDLSSIHDGKATGGSGQKKKSGNVQQNGKTYIARLCYREYTGGFDRDLKAQRGSRGKELLLKAMYSDAPVAQVTALIPDLSMTWVDIKTQNTVDGWKGTEVIKRLEDAVCAFLNSEKIKPSVRAYLDSYENSSEILNGYLERIRQGNVELLELEKNNKTDPRRRDAFILLKAFHDEFSIGLMKCFMPPAKKKAQQEEQTVEQDDPIKVARGTRGYVCKYFTEYYTQNPWKDFDTEAFTEALKVLNQFADGTRKRSERQNQLKRLKEEMEGKGGITNQAEDEESNHAVAVTTDPRWKLLQDILKKLSLKNAFTNYETTDYGLTGRTMKGFRALRKCWCKALKDNKSITQAELLRLLQGFQAEHADSIGSVQFFQELTEEKNWCLWDGDCQAASGYSSSFLWDVLEYYDTERAIEKLNAPLRFTPADAIHSRRLSNLKGLVASTSWNGRKYGPLETLRIKAKIAVVKNHQLTAEDCIIEYSAPRLKRDGLQGGVCAKYLTPVLKALVPDLEQKVDFGSCAVQLMPTWDLDGHVKILLNFPVSLSLDQIQARLPNRLNKYQFVGKDDQKFSLKWPMTVVKDKTGELNWFENPETAGGQEGFSFVSVDLGQRTGGAMCSVRVTTTPKNEHSICIGQAGRHRWYAERTYAGLIKLPGENARIWQHGQWETEPYGAAGRKATEAETQQALELCRQLLGSSQLFERRRQLTFPRQNSLLLIALRRAQGRWANVMRWIRMLENPELSHQVWKDYQLSFGLDHPVHESELETELYRRDSWYRSELPKIVVILANRILPLVHRKWVWKECSSAGTGMSYGLFQEEGGLPGQKPKIYGQGGISFARIEQLEMFRKRIQSLNRTLMNQPAEPLKTSEEMRQTILPDPCPDVLRKINSLKKDRVNQTANRILLQALGVSIQPHSPSNKEERESNGVHGELRILPQCQRASFIVLEDLQGYSTHFTRSSHENSRLMVWCRRQVREKVKMLAEVFDIHLVEVNPAFSSQLSSAGIPGFRAQELSFEQFQAEFLNRKDMKLNPDAREHGLDEIYQLAFELHGCRLPILLPRDGGPIFVPICMDDYCPQADINAAFNLGLRAVNSPENHRPGERIRIKKTAKDANTYVLDYSKEQLQRLGFSKEDYVRCPSPDWKGKSLLVVPQAFENADYRQASLRSFLAAATCNQLLSLDRQGKESLLLMDPIQVKQAVYALKLVRCLELNRQRLAEYHERKQLKY